MYKISYKKTQNKEKQKKSITVILCIIRNYDLFFKKPALGIEIAIIIDGKKKGG